MSIVAIVGRPNVGKSTLFNRFVQQREAITEKESGITRDRKYGVVTWNNLKFDIIDTGGYDTKSISYFQNDINNQIQIAMEESDLILFILDSKVGITALDLEFANILRKKKKKNYCCS